VTSPAHELLRLFRGMEGAEQLAPLIVDEEGGSKSGFDVVTLRVLAAWMMTSHRWTEPKGAPPDGGMPTASSWSWLWSSYKMDVGGVAAGADTTREVARERLEVLRHNRLVYPDGSCTRFLLAAVRVHVGKRLNPSGKRKEKAKEPTEAN